METEKLAALADRAQAEIDVGRDVDLNHEIMDSLARQLIAQSSVRRSVVLDLLTKNGR